MICKLKRIKWIRQFDAEQNTQIFVKMEQITTTIYTFSPGFILVGAGILIGINFLVSELGEINNPKKYYCKDDNTKNFDHLKRYCCENNYPEILKLITENDKSCNF
ncbi:MAG: hypothetical protein Satyrvirus8_14 [Satyrvirus sp.]|uniref:Uncharacterized protein n=1 Tax=Satyrvirus sp. TaxID=2487771 RepID=A0A3G5ADG0_9VIRU|nr:MAG: hypothetical protein Satyrvirus8_14 [Satyrvirus sp.]